MGDHTKKPNSKKCKEELHTIEWCDSCRAVICQTCKDKDCSLLDRIFEMGLKQPKPAPPDPFGVTY